jgi:tricorn protease
MHRPLRAIAIVVSLLFVCEPPASAGGVTGEARLLRFPAIHGEQIVFTYAGDLYTVPAQGGIARRLTSHEGFEMFARFSPDGKSIAFTGQYDGNTEVYLMPAEGGVPRRLTYSATLNRDDVSDRMGPNNIVMGWKNNDEILFRSRMHSYNDFMGELFTVSVKGGLAKQVPLPRGGFASYSPDGTKLAYNRIFREFRTWKRYRGGMADDVWIYDFVTKKIENITNNDAGDIIPMWSGNKIYYLSDRDDNKRFNLYVYDLSDKSTRQLTKFTDWDIKFPSLGDKAIVFEYAGYIYKFDLATEKAVKVPIQIREDLSGSRTGMKDVSKNIQSYEISPDGKRALFDARGDLFIVPAKDGATRNLTGTSGVFERNPKFSPDGKWIAFISDASGEDQIHIMRADGKGGDKQLTSTQTRIAGPEDTKRFLDPSYLYQLVWSPDSTKIMWADKKMRLLYVEIDPGTGRGEIGDITPKTVRQVAQGKRFEIHNYVWSPDSKWVAYGRPDEDMLQKVWLHSVEQQKSHEVTDGWYDSSQPEFSGDGKYLYFVSERDFKPIYSETEWNHAYTDMARIYFVTLAKDTKSPFAPKTDDEPAPTGEKSDKTTGDKGSEKEKKKAPPAVTKIDVDGIKDRILQLPIPAARYGNLSSVGANIFYIRASKGAEKPALFFFDLATKKETPLGPVTGYEISADGKKMLVHKDNAYGIIDLPKAAITLGETLNLSGLQANLDRHKEWQQIFHASWRQMRDFFYDPNLHGVDWPAIRKRYEPLLEHVNHRADLTYVIGEMISELGAGHAYVGGGDFPRPQRIPMGLLGAQLSQDEKTRFYKIDKILKGSNWDAKYRSPLAEIGVDVSEGEYILAVNGRATDDMVNIYEALQNTAGKQVRLKIGKEPSDKNGREIVVVPIADEHPLYYYNWVQGNIKKVADASGGKAGYLHIPDMQQTGLSEFAKHYYPQLRKKALIIDVRGNGGGNVSPMIIERLRREIAMYGFSRDTPVRPEPIDIFQGPMVCLMNEFSASDGDLFPYRFRHYKLGKLIGKRSWGGVIGIRGSLPFLDGGTLNRPEFSRFGLDGKTWIIENIGVTPDVIVDNDPGREYAGIDDQLNRSIEVVMEELRTQEKTLPPIPPFPTR